MALKNIPDPGFSADDGSADPALAEALDSWRAAAAAPEAEARVLAALTEARLLVPVIAVFGAGAPPGPQGNGGTTDEPGLRTDKTSEMAVPTLTSPGGRRALPAFTGTEALARWNPTARPVAVPLRQALHALAHEKADTLVLDLAGPVTFQVTGPALRALAAGRTGTDPTNDPQITAALRALLAAEPHVAGAHLAAGAPGSDATLALTLTADTAADPGASAAAVRRLASALAADEALRARLVRGLELALLPPGSTLPEGALYRR